MKVIAIACADLHIWHRRPVARSAEPDWFAAQARPLRQLRELQLQHKEAKVLYAGDIFHRYNPTPETINFAIEELPFGYAAAGQHDQQFHGQNLRRCGIWTLDLAKAVELQDWYKLEDGYTLYCFDWGRDLDPSLLQEMDFDRPYIALIHRYISTQKASYPGSPEGSRVSAYRASLRPFDLAIFGDNHIPFEARAGDCRVFNCGAFIRRRRPEREFPSSVGLVYEDGSVKRVPLDCSEDRWSEVEDEGAEQEVEDLVDYMEEFAAADSLDYEAEVRRAAETARKEEVRKILLETLDSE